jgi:hypothetical protein
MPFSRDPHFKKYHKSPVVIPRYSSEFTPRCFLDAREDIYNPKTGTGLHYASVQKLNLFTRRAEKRSALFLKKICTCECFWEGFRVRPIWGFGAGCCFMHEDYTLVRV